MDTIRLLLQAKIDTKQSIPIINEQIKAMTNQLSKLKLQVKIDDKDLGNIQNINKKAEQSFDDVFKSSKQYNDELHNLIHAYKTQQIAAQNFVETASKYRQEQEFSQLSEKQQIQLVNTLQRAEKEHVGTLKETLNVRRKIANEQARMQEQVKSFQLKMLGTDKIPGEMDTFAQKQKGKFDPEGLAYLRKEVELLGNLPLEQQASRVKELNIEWGLFTKTAQQSGNVLARTFENMYKFMRFYIVGGIIVRVIRSIRNSIGFIKELDKELTQVSIVQGLTRNQTLELAKSYATLALEMGKTVTEISKVNTELVRQGLSMEESQNRLNTILRLSATAGIDTSQSMRIITSSVNALGEESERTADIMLKAANISASNVEQIGSAFTKVASSAKATGVSITELSAIISTLVEVTQEDPRSLGTSLNTLLSRFNRINEETGELNQNFNDVHRAFTSVGISFLDAEGQIRPVYELLHDLSGIWDSLDRNTKMYISTQAAGTRQQNRFLAIMDNFNRVMEINEELMDSAGTLSESYSIYLNSVEASANRTKASLEQMWINAINSEAIKMFYDISTAIIKLVDRVGLLNAALFALIFVVSLATRQFSGLRTALVGFSAYVTTAITEMGILKGVLFSLKTAFDVVGASAIALQVALSLGLSVVITTLVAGISKLINRTQELKNANMELVQSYKRNVEENRNNIERLKAIGSEYENIRHKLKNHIELNEEERRTLDEIIAINPTLLQGYDDRGQAIINTTQSIDDMIKSLERANEIEDARLALGGGALFKEARNGIAKTQRDIDKLVNKIDDLQHGRAIRTSIGIVARDRLTGLDYLERQYDHLKQTLGENAQETQKVAQKITEKRMALKNLETQLSTYQQTLKTQSVEVKNALFAHTRLTDSYKKLSGELRNFVADYIRSIDILDFEDFIEMQVAVDNLIESLKSNEGKQFINQYAKLKSQLDENAISTKKFNEEIKKLINNIKDKELKNAITHFFSASKEQSSATKELMTLDKQLDNIRQTYVGAVDTIEEYNKTLQDLNESKELNYKALLNLAEAHPRLLLYMNDRKKLIEEITRLRDEEVEKTKQSAEAQIKIVHDRLLREVNLYLKTSSLKKNIYETDFENYKSLGEAKLALEQRLQEKIIEMNSARLYAESLTGYDKVEAQRMYVELYKQVEYAKSLLRDVGIGLELGDIEVDFSGLGLSSKVASKEEYKASYDIYSKINQELDKNNVLLAKNKTLQELATEGSAEQLTLIQEENALYKERQGLLHQLNQQQREEALQLQKDLSAEGFKFIGSGDSLQISNLDHVQGKSKEVEESFKRFNELQHSLIPQTSQQRWDYQKSIVDNIAKIEATIQSHIDQLKVLEDELDNFDLAGKIEELNKQLDTAKFNHWIENLILGLERYNDKTELLSFKLSLFDEEDYENRSDVIGELFNASKDKLKAYREEWDKLSAQIPQNANEASQIASAMKQVQQGMRDAFVATRDYQRQLEKLQFESISSEFEKANKQLEMQLSIIDHNLQSLQDGILPDFSLDMVMPIPDFSDIFDETASENEKIYNEQANFEKQIQSLKKQSLEMQLDEAEKFYEEEKAKLIKHYKELVKQIADKEAEILELQKFADEQQKAQLQDSAIEIQNIVDTDLNTLEDLYATSWDNIVGTVRDSVAQIKQLVSQANSAIASMGSAPSSSSRGSTGSNSGSSESKKVSKYAKGGTHQGGISLVGEEGIELGLLPSGKAIILGKNGSELVDIPKGTQVIPHEETKDILSHTGNIDGKTIPKYKDGTGEAIPQYAIGTGFIAGIVGAVAGTIASTVSKVSGTSAKLKDTTDKLNKANKQIDRLNKKIDDLSNISYASSTHTASETSEFEKLIEKIKPDFAVEMSSAFKEGYDKYLEDRKASLKEIADLQKQYLEGTDEQISKEEILAKIDAQMLEDTKMQSLLKVDLLEQMKANVEEYTVALKEEYDASIKSGNTELARQIFEEYNNMLTKQMQVEKQIQSAIKERYNMEFALIDKKLSKEKQMQDSYKKQIDILKELNANDYDGFLQYNELILQAEQNKLIALRQSSQELSEQLALLKVGSMEWNIINEQLGKVNSSIQDSTLAIIRQNKEILRNKYDKELRNIEKSLFGGQTLDEARKELNDRIKYQNEYVGGLEKELMVSKIISDARKNNVELTKSELALLNQSGNIEKVKLERLEKQLNVRMLEQKLSSLQNQKTIQQLTKQNDGTWDFTYVADQDAIYDAEQELKNAKLDLIRWERDLDNRKRQEELDSKSQYLDELRRLTERSLQAEYQSLSEFYTDANKITSEFYNEVGSSVHSTIDALAGDFNSFLETLDNFKSTVESYDIPENSILGIVGDGSVVQQANDIINELLQIQDKALEGQYNSFNEFIEDIGSLGDGLNETYSLIWNSIIEKQLASNDILEAAYNNLLEYYKNYVFKMSNNTEELTDTIVNSSFIIEESINFMTKMVQQMATEAEKASFSALQSAETAAQAMISAIESARGASQAASDAAKSAAEAAYSASNIADKIQASQTASLEGIQKFDTGGYTGDFKNGKLAVLHEKELVLNKVDTSNLLKAVNITRDIFSNIKIPTVPKMQPAMASGSGDQVFNISKLEFPNVRDAGEIEKAIKSLSIYANQWANRK